MKRQVEEMSILTEKERNESIEKLNRGVPEDFSWFVCYGCNKLQANLKPRYLPIRQSRAWSRPFCDECTKCCQGCGKIHCSETSWMHQQCVPRTKGSDDDYTPTTSYYSDDNSMSSRSSEADYASDSNSENDHEL